LSVGRASGDAQSDIRSVAEPALHDWTEQVRLRAKHTAFQPEVHDREWRNLTVAVEDVVDNMPRRDEQPVAADVETRSNQPPRATYVVTQQRKCVTDRIWKRPMRRNEVPGVRIGLSATIGERVWHTYKEDITSH
jgi:hypothetical protein